jgi:cytochrome c-type biogenesis protein CcmE
MKPGAWVGLVIIIAALAFGAKSFVTNLIPYVSFTEAKASAGAVQVMGKLDKSTIADDLGQLTFTIVDKDGNRMPVAFTSARPPNFQMALEVTAQGKFDGQTFRATNLLVKCPTKYQGTETKSYAARG